VTSITPISPAVEGAARVGTGGRGGGGDGVPPSLHCYFPGGEVFSTKPCALKGTGRTVGAGRPSQQHSMRKRQEQDPYAQCECPLLPQVRDAE
jgi:hypothetical protein